MSIVKVVSNEDDYCIHKLELKELILNQKKLASYTKKYKAIFFRRHIIIDYYLNLHEKLRSYHKTLHMAISLFDNFMDYIDNDININPENYMNTFNPIQITKISLVTFYVAYKFEESYSLTIDMIQKYFIRNSSVFSKEEFLNLEALLLKTLNFKLLYVNLYSFHECFYEYIFQISTKKEELPFFPSECEESSESIENLKYKNFISDVMKVNEHVITIVISFKEIIFLSETNENFDSLKLSELAVVSLKISILFFHSIYERKKNILKKFNQCVLEFFEVNQNDNLKMNRCALNLFNMIKDSLDKVENKVFKGLKEILKDLDINHV